MLVETKLDRLGRILDRRPIDRQQAGGVGHRVHYLALGGVDLTSPAGKMTMGVIAAVAQSRKTSDPAYSGWAGSCQSREKEVLAVLYQQRRQHST